MDTNQPSSGPLQEQRIREMVAHYRVPDFLSGFEVKFDETWDGDPAIHVYYYGPMFYRATNDELAWMRGVVEGISAEAGMICPDRSTYVVFVAQKDQAR